MSRPIDYIPVQTGTDLLWFFFGPNSNPSTYWSHEVYPDFSEFDLTHHQAQTLAEVLFPFPQNIINIDLWQHEEEYPQFPRGETYFFPTLFFDESGVRNITDTLAWAETGPFPEFIPFDPNICQFSGYVEELTSSTQVLMDRWHEPNFDKVLRLGNKEFLYAEAAFVFDPTVFPPPEVLTVDKWWQELEAPQRDVAHLEYLYQNDFYTVEPSVWPVPEIITFDKWYQPLSEPQRDVEHREYLFPDFDYVAEPSVWPSPLLFFPDQFHQHYPDFAYEVDREEYQYAAFFYTVVPSLVANPLVAFVAGIEDVWKIPGGGRKWTIPSNE